MLSVMTIGHLLELLPPNIFGDLTKSLSASLVVLIISFIALLVLHLIKEENYPSTCIFVAGLLVGICLSFAWGINAAFTPLAIATVPIFRAGISYDIG